jgi:hypothetical protein
MSEAAILAAALEEAPGLSRDAYLAEACAGDEKLRRRVEALLRAHAEPDEILDPPQRPAGTIEYTPIAERVGTQIGPYIIREQIGEGGFGLVFVAEQTEPVKRKVALKIIKPGMDSAQVIARFEAERQALALMDHPNIARVLDAGATDTGRPYFVMELVRGIPITEYCDKNQLAGRFESPKTCFETRRVRMCTATTPLAPLQAPPRSTRCRPNAKRIWPSAPSHCWARPSPWASLPTRINDTMLGLTKISIRCVAARIFGSSWPN